MHVTWICPWKQNKFDKVIKWQCLIISLVVKGIIIITITKTIYKRPSTSNFIRGESIRWNWTTSHLPSMPSYSPSSLSFSALSTRWVVALFMFFRNITNFWGSLNSKLCRISNKTSLKLNFLHCVRIFHFIMCCLPKGLLSDLTILAWV